MRTNRSFEPRCPLVKQRYVQRQKSLHCCQWRKRRSGHIRRDDLGFYFLDKCHAIDLVQRGHAEKHLLYGRFAKRRQAFFLRLTPDLRTGTPFDDHFADGVGHIEKFVNSGSSAITGMVARIASDTSEKYLLGTNLVPVNT